MDAEHVDGCGPNGVSSDPSFVAQPATGAQRSPRVAAVCVTHDSQDLLAECVASLRTGPAANWPRVVIVDSGSRDASHDLAVSLVGPADAIWLGANRGYAAGINAGLAHLVSTGGADVVLLLNPDVSLWPGAGAALAEALQGDGVGISAPVLLDEQGRRQLSLRLRPRLASIWCEALLGGPLTARLGLPSQTVHHPELYEREGLADWATGGALAVSWDCLQDVGEWEESYFLYDEEVDFTLRARDKGWRLVHVPSARVTRRTASGDSPLAYVLIRVNRVSLMRRHGGRWAAASTWCALMAGELLRALTLREPAPVAVRALLFGWTPSDVLRWAQELTGASTAPSRSRRLCSRPLCASVLRRPHPIAARRVS